jgi:hypothetical protein
MSEQKLISSGTASKLESSPLKIPFYIERNPFTPFPSTITIGIKYVKQLWDPSYWTVGIESTSDNHAIERSCPH